MKLREILLVTAVALILSACPLSNMGQGGAQQPSQAGASATSLSVETDTSRNQGVLVEANGATVDIKSVTDDGTTVSCVDAVGIATLSEDSSTKSLSKGSNAIIIGMRNDGNAGVWAYASGKMQSVIDEDSGELTSRLPDSNEQNGVFRGPFGWVYHVMGISEDGKIIIGYAENKKGFHWGSFVIDPGTTIGVYWQVSRHHFRPFYMVSRAHIIATIDQSKLSSSNKHVQRWINWTMKHLLDQLKLFLINYLSSYLTMVDKNGVHFDSANNIYDITGTDQDDQPAVATIDQKGNITITEQQQNQTPPSVYVAGSYSSGNTTVAAIWVNGTKTDLPGDGNSAHASNAYSIAVSGGNVYVAGSYFNGTTTIACYWVNGKKTDLPGDGTGTHPSTAYSITVSGGTIYTAGYYSNGSTLIAAYWTGTTKTDLPGIDGAIASSIFVFNGVVYTAGQYGVFDNSATAAYWQGTTKTDLPGTNGAAAQSVFVSNGTVYTSGEYNVNSSSVPCYWTGTTKQDLPGTAGSANSIYVSGGTIYTAGQYQASSAVVASLWTGTTKQDLMTTGSSAQSIFVSGSTIYTAGYYANGTTTVASYWTGTAKTDLPGTSGQAMSIVAQ
jgi:hypothetical protein